MQPDNRYLLTGVSEATLNTIIDTVQLKPTILLFVFYFFHLFCLVLDPLSSFSQFTLPPLLPSLLESFVLLFLSPSG